MRILYSSARNYLGQFENIRKKTAVIEEESGERSTVVSALTVTGPDKWEGEGGAPPPPTLHHWCSTHRHSLAGSVTIRAKTTVHCSPGSSMCVHHISVEPQKPSKNEANNFALLLCRCVYLIDKVGVMVRVWDECVVGLIAVQEILGEEEPRPRLGVHPDHQGLLHHQPGLILPSY